MKRVFFTALLLTLAGATSVRVDEAPLTPRFMRMIGVHLQSAVASPRFLCGERKPTVIYESTDSQRGLTVSSTIDGSPAQEAGLHCGDLIIAANGQAIDNLLQLRAAIDSDRGAMSIRLTMARPVPVSVNSNGLVSVRYGERREFDLALFMHDRIAMLKDKGKPEHVLAFDDEYGKKFRLRVTSSFVERANDMMEYSCSFIHEGEQETVLLESPYFSALGSTEFLPVVRRGETKTYTLTSSIERGIPVRTSIPIEADRHVYIGKVHEYNKETNRGASLNEEGDASGDWHSWIPFTIECWVPESVARAIDRKRKRVW